MSDTGTSMRRRRLARALRHYRQEAGLSADQAAAELLCGAGTISRMENGQSAEPLRVKGALELYRAPAEVIAEMVEIAKQGRRRGAIRKPYHEFVPRRLAEYYELEDEADTAALLEGEFVPGLLQTPDYARALITSWDPTVPTADVTRLLDIRMDRQKRLSGANSLSLRVLLGEAALHTQVGGPHVLKEQLRQLGNLAEGSLDVAIKILPWASGARPALGRNFTVLTFPDPADPPVIFAESVSYFVLEDENDEVAKFADAYNRLWEMALDEPGSARLLARAASEIK